MGRKVPRRGAGEGDVEVQVPRRLHERNVPGHRLIRRLQRGARHPGFREQGDLAGAVGDPGGTARRHARHRGRGPLPDGQVQRRRRPARVAGLHPPGHLHRGQGVPQPSLQGAGLRLGRRRMGRLGQRRPLDDLPERDHDADAHGGAQQLLHGRQDARRHEARHNGDEDGHQGAGGLPLHGKEGDLRLLGAPRIGHLRGA